MKIAPAGMNGLQEVLERKEAELARVLQKRDHIANREERGSNG
jgi:hypothetical protein